jgi:hypothetical protein
MKRGNANQPAGDEEQGATPEQKRAGQRADRKGMTRREMLGVLGAMGASVGGTAWFMSGDKEEEDKEKKDSKTEEVESSEDTPAQSESSSRESIDDLLNKDEKYSKQKKKRDELLNKGKEKSEKQKEKERKALESIFNEEQEIAGLTDKNPEQGNGTSLTYEAAAQSIKIGSVQKLAKVAVLAGKNYFQMKRAKRGMTNLATSESADDAQVDVELKKHLDAVVKWQVGVTNLEIPATALAAISYSIYRILDIASSDVNANNKSTAIKGIVMGDAIVGALMIWRLQRQGQLPKQTERKTDAVAFGADHPVTKKTLDTEKIQDQGWSFRQAAVALSVFDKELQELTSDTRRKIRSRPKPKTNP